MADKKEPKVIVEGQINTALLPPAVLPNGELRNGGLDLDDLPEMDANLLEEKPKTNWSTAALLLITTAMSAATGAGAYVYGYHRGHDSATPARSKQVVTLKASSDSGVASVKNDAGVPATQPVVAVAKPEPKKADAPAKAAVKSDSNYITIAILPALNLRNVSSFSLAGAEAYMKRADLVIGGLDGMPVSDETLQARLRRDESVFSTPPAALGVLKENHFGVAALAGRWAGDFGDRGIIEVVKNLDILGIQYAGIKPAINGSTVAMSKVKGKTICTHSYTYGVLTPLGKDRNDLVNIVNLNAQDADLEEMTKALQDVKGECDIDILYLHWGLDRQKRAVNHIKAYAKTLAEAGADIIIGSRPLYVQDFEKLDVKDAETGAGRSVPVFYSLGKLVTPNAITPERQASAVVLAEYNLKTASMELKYAPMMLEKKGEVYTVADLAEKADVCKGDSSAACRKTHTAWCYLADSLPGIKPARKVDVACKAESE